MIVSAIWFLLIIGFLLTSVVQGIIFLFTHHVNNILIYAAIGLVLTGGLEGILVLRLRSTINSYSRYWHSSAKHDPKHLLYVALGDSAAQGIGASSIDHSYVEIVARHIAKQTGRVVDVVNLSKSGGKLHDVLNDQLPELSKLKPDFVTIDIGANDIVGGTSRDEMTHWYDQLIGQLRMYPVVFANIPDFMLGTQQQTTQDMNKALKELCLHYGVRQADLNDATIRKMWALNQFAADGFHPSNAGHRTWASAFIPSIDKLIGTDAA